MDNKLLDRRYDLDWLRVLVFGLLIFYHVGMLYVADWGYHYKSAYQSEALQSVMILVNQWRLPLLFLISGVAIRFLINKVSISNFIVLRTVRLWIPLLFGIWVVVPPQLYIEMTMNGELPAISYHQFYQAFWDLSHPYFINKQSGIFPHVDVNHLWYIRELWYFSVYLLVAWGLVSLLKLKNSILTPFKTLGINRLYLFWVLTMILLHFFIFPMDSEGTRIAKGFSFLCWGFLIGWETNVWQQLKQNRRKFLVIAVILYCILITYYNLYYQQRLGEPKDFIYLFELMLVYSNQWAWIIVILGYASYYLNHYHSILKYLNEAVYPYYILHQTIIIVCSYWLSFYKLGPLIEPILVILITFAGCALLFEVIKRSVVLRLLFGLKIGRPK